jgi:hypothetical protein
MSFLRQRLGKWAAPIMVSALVLVVGGVGTAIGAKFITGKKVVKTITKKTQAKELRVTGAKEPGGTFNYNAPEALMGALALPKGPHVVQATYTQRKDTGGLVVTCKLRLTGVGEDSGSFFGGGGQIQVPSALSVSGTLAAPGAAELRCADGSAGNDSQITDIEITATKLPKVKRFTAP